MSDYLVKALAFDGNIRAYAVDTTEMVSEAQRRQKTLPTASAALGRAMSASTMMASMLKSDSNKLTVKIEGGGPIGALIVDSNAKGETRGYVSNPNVHFDLNKHGKLDVARAVGKNGHLSVVKDLGMRENFTGQVPLVSGELGEDFTYYFVSSEQIPSAVAVGVLVNPDNSILASGGFVIQVMPGAQEEMITFIEKRLENTDPVSKMIDAGDPPEQLLYNVLGEENVQILSKSPVSFSCSCSRERFADAIVSLGEEEIQDMIIEDGKADANCHFCNETYHYTKEDLEALLEEARRVKNG
ncbi:Hsp33 family molecular chaperone HslO [Pseudalkalibacillus salsuginis]|uniref:Hsp33 family molecular chaperone HslO n=1 Tax=Pseudalkalibacillus salsuginis TaxID=2910972 RepID=UPI001F1A5296|nr:Hsp33 family molecular chaperone HslO [Pseudalkalibacillus salsuginis]MCF6411901.1 Hsp33 family molecular chaperone HslO [Pseudalkalibacillus salsuginis]